MPYQPDTTCPTVDAAELAEWLGYSGPVGFQNASRKLILEHGFPRKLPGVRRWSRAAVLQWIARQGGAERIADRAATPLLDPTDDDIELARQDLERLYANDGFRREAAE